MNQPSTPPGYGQAPGYGGPPPQSSGAYPSQPQGVRGMTRQVFNPATYKKPGSASWAAASFILALVGWLTLGCLGILTWPLGLLFGLIGMFGNKRAKGLSFAGFLLSGIGLAGVVALFALGLWQLAWTESYAEQGGAPVVAAVEQFKADHERVPYSIEELVEQAYLPATWDHGLDELDDEVRGVVEGRRWEDFLAYAPGKDADWEGSPDGAVNIDLDLDRVTINVPEEVGENPQSYGLVFIGTDNEWKTYDDTPVNQAPEEPFELGRVWDADPETREAMTKQRQLKVMLRRMGERLDLIDGQLGSASEALEQHEERLRQIASEKGLSRDEIRTDPDTAEWLKLIGETARRLEITRLKKDDIQSKRNVLEAKVARLGNQVELSKIADSRDELSELESLLEESRQLLEGDGGYFADKSDSEFADEWLNENFD